MNDHACSSRIAPAAAELAADMVALGAACGAAQGAALGGEAGVASPQSGNPRGRSGGTARRPKTGGSDGPGCCSADDNTPQHSRPQAGPDRRKHPRATRSVVHGTVRPGAPDNRCVHCVFASAVTRRDGARAAAPREAPRAAAEPQCREQSRPEATGRAARTSRGRLKRCISQHRRFLAASRLPATHAREPTAGSASPLR
mmetsp:Transcript_3613/g.11183  ORF Transcript_3613/g.11183 Transcript_3613/m.11183 type:complete len:200 (-) Transcript_3613:70-669(-)